jgi:hypothetical protein
MRFLTALFAVAALCATSVLADETWNSDMGTIVYEDEIDGAAVFSFNNVDGYRAVLVIPGLAGNFNNRGVHEAFWIGQGAGYCLSAMSMGGQSSHQWGRALISFDTPAYPTSFTLSLGECFDPLAYAIRASAN